MDTTMQTPSAGGIGAAFVIFAIIYVAIALVEIIAMWKIFTKAGKPGWAILVPVYNLVVLLQILDKPIWWIILFILILPIPILAILLSLSLAEVFGKSTGFAIGLILLGPVFIPILGFGSAQYKGGAPAAG